MAQTHEILPGELATLRAVSALGYGLGAVGGVTLWIGQPETIRSSGVAMATTLACVVMTLAVAFMPWERVNRRWLSAPPLVGAAVIATAIANMDGGREVYEGFYLYIALAASYFLPGGQVRVVVAAVALGAALPLLEDMSVASIVRWAYVAAGTGIITFVLRVARQRVRAFAAEVRTLALQDQLTGALNRRGFELRATQEFGHARRRGEGLVLLYLDLDGFKLVNDNLSHAAGDRVLQRTAHAMAGVLRVEDVLARVGGDEFVVLFWASDEHAAYVSERLVQAVEAVAAEEPGAGHVSATTGWAVYPTDGATVDALMNAADATVLERKRERLMTARSR